MTCIKCSELEDLMKKVSVSYKYSRVTTLASNMVRSGGASLISGDCDLAHASAELETEKHYAIQHVIECNSCSTRFNIGGCIRGPAKYDVIVKKDA